MGFSNYIDGNDIRENCTRGCIQGAFLIRKTWNISEDDEKSGKIPKLYLKQITLLDILKREWEDKMLGKIYHRVQVDLTYNSNHIEGSRLTHE